MALLPTSVDYTDRDEDSWLVRLKLLATSAWSSWTDFSRASFGNILLGLYAKTLDRATFYLDNMAREAFLPTAIQRKNVLNHCKRLIYTPKAAIAAQFSETFSFSPAIPTGNTLTIPAGTILRTANPSTPQSFQLLAAIAAAAGATSATGTVEHSQSWLEQFTSTSTPNQEVTLARNPYVDSSVIVSASNGSYVARADLISSTSTDRHYTVSVDQNNRLIVSFGDGVNGAIPTGTISIQYKTGGGVSGNVASGAINRIAGTFLAQPSGQQIVVTVTNLTTASVLGQDRETITQIRTKAPAQLRILRRAIAREDFEIAAIAVSGVATALMLTTDEDASVQENEGILYVVPTGGGAPSTALKSLVEDQFTGADAPYPKPTTFILRVQDPVYKTINVRVTVAFREGAVPADAKQDIVDALTELFQIVQDDGTLNPRVDFGYYFQDVDGDPTNEFAWSDVFNAIRDVTTVRKIDAGSSGLLLNDLRADVSILPKEFPQLGTVTVINAATGLEV